MNNSYPEDISTAILSYRKPHTGGIHSKSYPDFILYISIEALKSYLQKQSQSDIEMICEVNEIYCNRSGTKTGILERPSTGELEDVFGTSKFADIVRFMLREGQWQPFDGLSNLGSRKSNVRPDRSHK